MSSDHTADAPLSMGARWLFVVVGLVAGGAVALVAAVVTGNGGGAQEVLATTSSSSTTTTAPADPVWVAPHEIILGSTALVPTEVDVQDGRLNLNYELVTITPGADPEIPEGALGVDEAELIFPRSWTAVTTRGEHSGSTPTVDARRARFDVPEGTAVEDVSEIRLDSYLVAVPFSFPLEMDPNDFGVQAIGPGVGARLQAIIEQRANFLVIVEMVAEDPFLYSDFIISGSGERWVRASRSQLGRPTWTLDYRGDALPNPLPLVAHGLMWVELQSTATIDIAGLR